MPFSLISNHETTLAPNNVLIVWMLWWKQLSIVLWIVSLFEVIEPHFQLDMINSEYIEIHGPPVKLQNFRTSV